MNEKTFSLAKNLLSGNRYALSKAITLVESTLPKHNEQAFHLMSYVLENKKNHDTLRLGISGSPGVGKSTFVEALGNHVAKNDNKLAVLAIDPSSTLTGGSILGDKTRMVDLTVNPNAYVRPSPSRCTLGGVTRTTNEVISLCEACGYKTIFVETVGVGQSEIDVEDMVDLFMLLSLPGGGDDLQGIKRGIMEISDIITINKADGDLLKIANRAKLDFKNALRLLPPKNQSWKPEVFTCSAKTGHNIDKIWETVLDFSKISKESGEFETKRKIQGKKWMWKIINDELVQNFQKREEVRKILPQIELQVESGTITPTRAADSILSVMFKK